MSNVILPDADLEMIEPHLYSVLSHTKMDSSYDKRFGDIYDWVACNRVYNRLVWGYSVSKFVSFTQKALHSSQNGMVLDIGCGSLAFTAREYIRYAECAVVLVDQSMKLLKMAKERISKKDGRTEIFTKGQIVRQRALTFRILWRVFSNPISFISYDPDIMHDPD